MNDMKVLESLGKLLGFHKGVKNRANLNMMSPKQVIWTKVNISGVSLRIHRHLETIVEKDMRIHHTVPVSRPHKAESLDAILTEHRVAIVMGYIIGQH